MLLKGFLEPLGLGAVEVAVRLGRSVRRFNDIVDGKRRINQDTARRLARLLNTSPQLSMRLQTGRGSAPGDQADRVAAGTVVQRDRAS